MPNKPMTKTTGWHQHYSEAVRFRPEAFTPMPVGQGEHLKAMLVCFEPEQFIPVHAPGIDLALVVLEGEGRLIAADEEVALQPGSLAFIPAGAKRGIKAKTRLVAFQVVSPVPTDADHAGVKAGLERGDWR